MLLLLLNRTCDVFLIRCIRHLLRFFVNRFEEGIDTSEHLLLLREMERDRVCVREQPMVDI